MKKVLWAVYITVWLAVFVAFAAAQQKPAAKTLEPTEVQHLRLEVAQKDAQLAYATFQQAQVAYQKAVVNLQQLGEQTKRDNKWPAEVTFDLSTLVFTQPVPPAPEKGQEKK